MKNIKDITISIFAIIGFVFILSSFTNQSQETHGTPESHVWEMHSLQASAYSFNKITGEVRKHNTGNLSIGKDGKPEYRAGNKYAVMVEAK